LEQVPAQVSADAQKLDRLAQVVDAQTAASNWDEARRQWRDFGETWLDVEDGFRDVSRTAYADIESSMVRVGDQLRVDRPDAQAVRLELMDLRRLLAPFVSGNVTVETKAPVTTVEGLNGLMATLDVAIASTKAGDVSTAQVKVEQFQKEWLDVEGLVKTRSAAVYRSSEDGMAHAAAMLKAQPPRTGEALQALEKMHEDLVPIASQPAKYGVFDAAVILLREGLEALLVVAALVAFLAKSGHGDKQRWIWGGAAVGVLVSMVAAFILQKVFSAATAGANRELVEGVIGLVAAGMLLYVSYWLHSKANIGAWQQYVREKTASAATGGGLLSLALISFLAVFREGAETVLFYAGIAPSIETGDLLLGLGIAAAGLTVVAVLMLAFGMRIPMRPFFMISSFLLYYLAFKFIGTGIHSLQVSNVTPATPAPVPSIDLIGLYPTWETTLPQLVLIAAAVGVLAWSRMRGTAQHVPAAGSPA